MGTKWRAPKKHNIKAWNKVKSGKILWDLSSSIYFPPTRDVLLVKLLKQKESLIHLIARAEKQIDLSSESAPRWEARLDSYKNRLNAIKVRLEKL